MRMIAGRLFAAVLGIGVYVFLRSFIPEPHCRDGWHSQSIGTQGACSHHGGVKRYGYWKFAVFVAAIAAGSITWAIAGRPATSSQLAPMPTPSDSLHPPKKLQRRKRILRE